MTWEGGRPRNKCPDLAGSIPDVCVGGMEEVEAEHGSVSLRVFVKEVRAVATRSARDFCS